MNVNKMAAHMRLTRSLLGGGNLLLDCKNITLYFVPKGRDTSRVFKVCTASFHSQHRQIPKWAVGQRNAVLFQKKWHLKHSLPASCLNLRFNSSDSSVIGSSGTSDSSAFIPPPDYIPPAPAVPLDVDVTSATADLAQSLNALGEPTLQSLGLGSYWPYGLVQQGLEAIHVGLGLPWWGSIILGTVIVRTCMFPIVVKAQRVSINMMNHMPTIQRLQAKFTDARQRGNMMEAMDYGQELSSYMKRNKINFFSQLTMPLFQLPVFVSVFMGLREMSNLPVESMSTGGCLWFPDLTISQPFYGLPLMTAVTLWLTIEAGADGMNASSQSHIMKWFLRAMPVFVLPIIVNFPTAMLVYWFTSNSFSLMQVLFLKIPQVRTFFGIPEKVKHPQVNLQKKGFVEGFREAYGNMKASQQVQERQRIDDVAMRRAAQGPIVKTYSYNPKEVKQIEKAKSNKIIAKSKS